MEWHEENAAQHTGQFWKPKLRMWELHETERRWRGTAQAVDKSAGPLNVEREVRACTKGVTEGGMHVELTERRKGIGHDQIPLCELE